MTNHALLIDAFENVGRFANQTLNYAHQIKQEEADEWLKTIPDEFTPIMDNYTRDNPYNYTGDPNNAAEREKYTREYESKLHQFSNKWFKNKLASRKRNADLPYYQKNIERMANTSNAKIRDLALRKEDEFRIQNEKLELTRQSFMYIDNYEPQKAYEAFENSIALIKSTQEVSPDTENTWRINFRGMLYNKNYESSLAAVKDVNDLEAAVNRVHETFSFMPSMSINTYDENGNVTGSQEIPWTYKNKKEYEKEIIEKETARIQKERFANFQEAQSYRDRLIASGKLNEAIQFSKQWGAEWNKYYNSNNPEYANSNEQFRNMGSNFFDWKKIEGYLSQGAVGKATALLDSYNLEMFLRPQIAHGSDGTVIVGYDQNKKPITENYKTLQDAFDGFIHYKREAFFYDKRNKGVEDYITMQLWEAEHSRFFENYYPEVGQALNQINPTLAGDFSLFMKTDTYITNEKSDYYNKDNLRKLTPYEKDLYGQRCVNFFNSIFHKGITDVPTIRQMMRDFTGSEIMRFLTKEESMPGQEGDRLKQLKAYSDKAMSGEAEHTIFRTYNPERLNISGKASAPTYEFRSDDHEKAITKYREEERRRLAENVFGIPISKLKPDWMPSGKIIGDVIPKGIFTIDEGEHAGTYYADYDNNANLIAKKQNGKDTNGNPVWEDYKQLNRQLTKNEAGSQNLQTQRDFGQEIGKNIHPITGDEFDYRTSPPPNITSQVWNNPRNTDEMKRQSWASYFQESIKNPPPKNEQISNAVVQRWRTNWDKMNSEERINAYMYYYKQSGRQW